MGWNDFNKFRSHGKTEVVAICDVEQARLDDALASLTAIGGNHYGQLCDVASAAAVREMTVDVNSKSPLSGVVHCAGVLADAMLAKQSRERLKAVWGAKVGGARNLHNSCIEIGCSLDMFVLYSSVSTC